MPIVLSPPSSFCAVSTVTLDGVAYRLRLRYDERLTSWYVDAWNAVTGSPIVKGARLVDGTPAGTGRPGLWPGALGAMPVGRGASLDNAEDLMSGRAVLVYYPAAEIPAFSAGGFAVSGEWTPLSLGPLVWLDPTDSERVFSDSAGTIPASIGDPVGLVTNKGSALAAADGVQTVSAVRGIYRGTHIEFDILNRLDLRSFALPDDATIVMYFNGRTSGNGARYFNRDAVPLKRIGSRALEGIEGSVPGALSTVAIGGAGKGYSEMWSREGERVRLQHKSVVTFSTAVQSGYSAQTGYRLGSQIVNASFDVYELLVIPGQLSDANRARLREYLEAKHGI